MEINGTMGASSLSQTAAKVATVKTENKAPQQGQDMSGAVMPQGQQPQQSQGIDTIA
jgi:hypothetical protein